MTHLLKFEEHEALERRADRSMARLSAPGALLYPIACVVAGAAAGYLASSPWRFGSLAAAVLALSVFRIYLSLDFDRLYDGRPAVWRLLFAGSLMVTLVIWTAISCRIILDHGVGGVAFFALLASVIMIDHSATVYTANRLLMILIVSVVVIPHVVVLLLAGRPWTPWMGLATLVYGVYVGFTGRRLHASYWRGLIDNRLQTLRGAELEQATAELARHRERLEAQVQDRTARLEEVVGSLEAKNLELERNKTEIEAKNAEMERFTYTVSHDLKSPLITVQGFLGLLAKDAKAGDTQRVERDIERIQGAVEKMGRLLEELLELSRIGRMVNPPERVGLTELAEEATELLTGRIEATGAEVTIAPNLPVVRGDRQRLLEVVQNLIDNAVKFAGAERPPRVEIGVRHGADGEVCFVRDNGPGIEPRYHDQVFGLFEKLNPHDAAGTGIGLALVQRIVDVHDGRIWIESEGDGTGATFCFTLPAPAADPEA